MGTFVQNNTMEKKITGKLCVLVNSLDGGGGERVATTLYGEYCKFGMDVVLVCLEKNDFYPVDGEVHYLSQQTGKGERPLTKFFSLISFAIKLKSFLKKNDICFVQSHLCRSNYVNVLAVLFGSRHIAQIVNHGIVSRYLGKKNVNGLVNILLVKWLYGKADQVILACKEMMKDLLKIGQFGNQMTVIGNPFDLSSIQETKDLPFSEDEFSFQEGKKYLITVGRLESVKRVEDVIKALDFLRPSNPNLELILLGDGGEKRHLRRLCQDLNLEDKVHFLGRVTNPYKYINRSHILVTASESEGFGNVIVEAFVCGTAVVSTDCFGGPRDIIDPNGINKAKLVPGQVKFAEFGVLVPVGDPGSIARVVEELLTDGQKLNSYRQKGIERARDFDKKKIAQKYIKQVQLLSEVDAAR